ncbi:hypothetical protein R5R35_003023 [Gryllus longicercus]|uniref:Aminomethyltransferase folate-binding domain-containing protein n=1 Tax=Gryllus longicercus TaxID=2509291 RepID=A0AAN9VUB3_9ORTH
MYAGKYPVARNIQASFKAVFRRQLSSQNVNLTNYSIEKLEGRGLLRVHGKEASTFLQGLVTNDMRHLEEGARSMYTMFLNIRGRVICDTVIYKDDNDTFLIEADKEVETTLQKHLKMYRVRKKIDIDTIGDLSVWVIFLKSLIENCDNKYSQEKQSINDSDMEHDFILKTFQQSKIVSRDPRLAELGYRLIVSSEDELLKDPKLSQDNQQPSRLYRQLRYKLGVGEGAADMPPGKCIPLEANCDFLHGVSFHKGCYIGQELTARVHHTGVVRKRLMPIVLNSEPPEDFMPGASVENALDNKALGKLHGLENKNGLALLKVSEALSAPALRLLNVSGFTKKPSWWPQEAPKERMIDKDM